MHILDLPIELLQQILSTSISARGLERGLRLRLVNKTFSNEVLQTILIYKLLEEYYATTPKNKDIRLPFFTAAYLERRVWSEPSRGLPGLVKLRAVAKRLCEETLDGRSQHDYVKLLCPLVVAHGSSNLSRLWRPSADGSAIEDDVYVAALYTQTPRIVEQRLASGKGIASYSWLFGSPHAYAAEHGSNDLLATLMVYSYADMVRRARLNMLKRVAAVGRTDAVRFVYAFKETEAQWEVDQGDHLGVVGTPSKEVYEFLAEKGFMERPSKDTDERRYTKALLQAAQKGWVEMSAHYIALGAEVDGYTKEYSPDIRPIIEACSNGHEEVVKLLLAHDASLPGPVLEAAAENGNVAIVRLLLEHKAELGGALAKAAEKGYGDVVEVLLEHGAGIESVESEENEENEEESVLAFAVRHEHERMFRLLVEPSKRLEDTNVGKECVEVAEERGLDSMLDLLRESGLYVEHTD